MKKFLKALITTVLSIMFIIIAVAFVSGFLEAIKNDTPHTSGDASVSEPVKSDKKSNGDYEIILRDELPVTLSYADYRGNIESSCSVTDFHYEFTDFAVVEKQDGKLYFSGEKTYDYRGPGQGDTCRISWQLFDADGYVVDSGTCSSPNVREGEKFKDALSRVPQLEPGTYYLELKDTN